MTFANDFFLEEERSVCNVILRQFNQHLTNSRLFSLIHLQFKKWYFIFIGGIQL